LWDKGGALDAAVLRLTTDRDPELDLHLVPWDCIGSAAHARMLESIGILTEAERAEIERELQQIAVDVQSGTFTIEREQEDGHTAIENRLTERLGDTGRKIHTGRSRNDQVLVALRLWGRDKTLEQLGGLLAIAEQLLNLADEHAETSFPGHTHTRQAMPTTLGHHFGAWAENLLDNVPWLQTSFDHLNRSPSGSASGFGVGLPLDRQMVSDLLGFAVPQANSLAIQNDRGKSEYLALGAAATAATDLGRLSADLLWFSSDELAFLGLSESVTTGSSLMPQKRNPDALELIRARAAQLRGLQAEVGNVYGGLTAGYHRDLQLTKEPFLRGMQSLVDMLATLAPVLESLEVDRDRCRAAVLPSSGATDVALAAAAKGTPFRKAYLESESTGSEVSELWRGRTHLGAPGDTDLGGLRQAHIDGALWLDTHRPRIDPSLPSLDQN
jgi:argininosuccinate lyase